MDRILYIFISHKNNINKNSFIIKTMMNELDLENNYIIVSGNDNTFYDKNNKHLYIKCNDYYEGLPEKVIKTFSWLIESYKFKCYDYFVKLDDDIIVKKKINTNIFKNQDYIGKVNFNEGNRSWHIGKCSVNSKYFNRPYYGKYIPWCLGGNGYVLSRKAIFLIKNDTNYLNHIYEDLYIALLLDKFNIKPYNMLLNNYLFSRNHN